MSSKVVRKIYSVKDLSQGREEIPKLFNICHLIFPLSSIISSFKKVLIREWKVWDGTNILRAQSAIDGMALSLKKAEGEAGGKQF